MRNERGMAMLIALVVAVLLSFLCLSMTFSSLQDFQISTEFENHEKALLIADAGYNKAKEDLRGNIIDQLLAQPGTINVYNADTTLEAWATRNPVSPIDARNLDFSGALPSGLTVTSVPVTGLLTSPTGTEIAGGRYFAKLTDNAEADGDLTVDSDGTVILRVIGISRNLGGETNTYNNSRKNSVAIIEGLIKRHTTLDMTSPMAIIGPGVDTTFQGSSFLVDGYNHLNWTMEDLEDVNKAKALKGDYDTPNPFPGISCLNEDGTPVDAIKAELIDGNQEENVRGLGGTKDTPSVADGTADLNEDAQNILDPAYLTKLLVKLASIADNTYQGDQLPDNDDLNLGTHDDPKITYINGDVTISWDISGAGILVVTGDLKARGSVIFEGLVLVIGSGVFDAAGLNDGILGGLVVSKLQGNAFGTSSISLKGNSRFFFSGSSIQLATSLLTTQSLSWREITPEIEPRAAATP
ncbi:MAG: hypothetical protein EHM61_09890 [Acidobacteria bacterium]|nr:MAG: hypothetical protein EHM61_09890 [Acidobacteriota bacterium]